jgi:hypothetical protein
MESKAPHSAPSTIDGKSYGHDVIIRRSGEVLKAEEEIVEEVLWHLACPLKR